LAKAAAGVGEEHDAEARHHPVEGGSGGGEQQIGRLGVGGHDRRGGDPPLGRFGHGGRDVDADDLCAAVDGGRQDGAAPAPDVEHPSSRRQVGGVEQRGGERGEDGVEDPLVADPAVGAGGPGGPHRLVGLLLHAESRSTT
jgi:hypothetical protein